MHCKTFRGQPDNVDWLPLAVMGAIWCALMGGVFGSEPNYSCIPSVPVPGLW